MPAPKLLILSVEDIFHTLHSEDSITEIVAKLSRLHEEFQFQIILSKKNDSTLNRDQEKKLKPLLGSSQQPKATLLSYQNNQRPLEQAIDHYMAINKIETIIPDDIYFIDRHSNSINQAKSASYHGLLCQFDEELNLSDMESKIDIILDIEKSLASNASNSPPVNDPSNTLNQPSWKQSFFKIIEKIKEQESSFWKKAATGLAIVVAVPLMLAFGAPIFALIVAALVLSIPYFLYQKIWNSSEAPESKRNSEASQLLDDNKEDNTSTQEPPVTPQHDTHKRRDSAISSEGSSEPSSPLNDGAEKPRSRPGSRRGSQGE